MTHAGYKLQVQIPADHHLSLELPPSFPAGPAEVIILTHAQEKRPILRAGGYLSAKVQIGPGDPVADALLEIRSEHADKVERLAAELERALTAGQQFGVSE